MYHYLYIHEDYSAASVTIEHERNKQTLRQTPTYLNASQDTQILIDEYIELDAPTKEWFYKNCDVKEFLNPDQTQQIIQIFCKEDVYQQYQNDPDLAAIYYLFLRFTVWHGIFNVRQRHWTTLEEEISPFTLNDVSDYNDAEYILFSEGGIADRAEEFLFLAS